MAKETRKFAATSNIIRVFIPDSSSTTGAGLTGVTYTSTGLVIDLIADNASSGYHYQSAATATIQDITTIGTFAAPSASNCRFKAVDGTNLPGLYEIQFLDGVFDDASSKRLIGCVRGVTNMAPTWFEIELVAYDPQDTVRLGLTALPNAAAEAAGGLYTRGTGAGQINQDANGRVDVSLKAILGTTLTETAGQIAAAFKKFFDKASPTGTINSIPDAVAGAAGGLFIAGTNAATTVTTSFTTTFTGNLTGSVGSVTGAVGSVTGSVGSIAGITFPTNFSALLINASGHVSRVTLTDTLTTYTGNTPQTGDSYAIVSHVTYGNAALKTLIDTMTAYVDTEVAAIKAKTDNLPASPANEATLTTIASYIDTEVAAIKAKTDNLPADPADASDIAASFASIASTLATLSAYVDTEVAAIKAKTDTIVDLTATRPEPGQGAPAATLSPLAKLDYVYKLARNKITQDATTLKVYADDGTTVDHKATISDDATTYTRGELATGP